MDYLVPSIKLLNVPYLGVEQYSNLPEVIANVSSKTSTVDPSYVMARYYLEYWPAAHSAGKGWQFVAAYSYREALNTEGVQHAAVSTAGINYYFDEKERFAVGLDYENGRLPTNNFVQIEKTSFSFKAKF